MALSTLISAEAAKVRADAAAIRTEANARATAMESWATALESKGNNIPAVIEGLGDEIHAQILTWLKG